MEYFVFHNNTGSFQRVTQGLTIGRTSGGIRYPSDLLVSREQCRFLIVGSEVYVEDSGSTNPTRINSVPLRPGKPRRVRLNDVIEFGSQRLILTNQDRFSPANVEDLAQRKIYRAIRKNDGSLTATMTGFVMEKTLVLINKAEARRLHVKRRLEPVRHHFATLSILTLGLLMWVLAYFGWFGEAVSLFLLRPDMEFVGIGVGLTLLSVAFYRLALRPRVRSSALAVLLSLSVNAGSGALLAYYLPRILAP
jgi:hypothetical protein